MGRRVLRNTTTRDDAVYIVECTLTMGVYHVWGRYGRWETFSNSGGLALRAKLYYEGSSEARARREFTALYRKKVAGHYGPELSYNTPLPWDVTQVVTRPSDPIMPVRNITVEDGSVNVLFNSRPGRMEITAPYPLPHVQITTDDPPQSWLVTSHPWDYTVDIVCRCGHSFSVDMSQLASNRIVTCPNCKSYFDIDEPGRGVVFKENANTEENEPPEEPKPFTRGGLLEF